MKREAILEHVPAALAIEPFAPVGAEVRGAAEAEAARLDASGVRWG